jgi:hypothetical protein
MVHKTSALKAAYQLFLDFRHLVDLSKEEITDSLKQLSKVTGAGGRHGKGRQMD